MESMALTNAQRQARWQAKRAAELRALREQVRQTKLARAEALSTGALIEALIAQLSARPAAERARAIVVLCRRLGVEVEETAPGERDSSAPTIPEFPAA
jgi:hypothetical protein